MSDETTRVLWFDFFNPDRLWALAILPVLVIAYLLLLRLKRNRGMRYTQTGIVGAVLPRQSQWRRHLAVALSLTAGVPLERATLAWRSRWLRRRFAARMARYEMQDVIGDAVVWDPPLVSGAFMCFRTDVLRRLGGFDSRFFLYFEDYDLSLRAARETRIAYVPTVKVVHHGGHAAKKGLHHIRLFMHGAALFFRLHGWRWF